MKIGFISFLFFGFFVQPTFAAYKDISVDAATVSAVDYTDKTNTIIFGGSTGCTTTTTGCSTSGYFGGCSTLSTTSTCNSCTGLTDLQAGATFYRCAYKNVHGALRMKFTFTVDSIPSGASLKIQWKESSGTTISPVNVPILVANSPITVEIDWNSICNAEMGTTCDLGSTEDAFSNTLLIAVTADAISTSNAMKFTVKWHNLNAEFSTLVTPCSSTSATSSDPFCYFSVSPGDKKVFVNELARGTVGPTSDTSGIKWQYARIYHAVSDCNLSTACTPTFASIPLGSNAQYEDLTITDKVNVATSLSTNKVTSGFDNEVDYMFNMATVDESTVVEGFLNPTALTAAKQATRPGQVVGLLDDKHCFVATAAFGSDMAPEVVWLRQFRNEFLLTNPIGKKLVKAYYRFSPPFANFISEHELLRATARSFLWPIILFAQMTLQFGILVTVFCLISAVFGFYFLGRSFLSKPIPAKLGANK